MFPTKLNRIQYLVRWLILVFGIGLIAAMTLPVLQKFNVPRSEIIGVVFLVVVLTTKVVGLDLPRIRSIGWSPWLLLLLIVPLAGAVVQILLFAMPPTAEVSAPPEIPRNA